MAITLTPKAPSERIAYLWTPALTGGDTISGVPTVALVTGTAATDGVTVIGATQVKIFLVAGLANETAEFLATVQTVGGETLQETIYLPVSSTALSAPGAKLIEIYPAFASVPASAVNYWIGQALETTGEWDNQHATILLAAHLMATNGLGASAVTSGLTSFKSGAVDMKFSEQQANTIGFNATPYGQQFHLILRRRYAGPITVSAGVVSCPC